MSSALLGGAVSSRFHNRFRHTRLEDTPAKGMSSTLGLETRSRQPNPSSDWKPPFSNGKPPCSNPPRREAPLFEAPLGLETPLFEAPLMDSNPPSRF